MRNNWRSLLSWILQVSTAIVLLQTLFFKFTGAEESVYIFQTLGLEPWGRIGSGIVELIASILILVPSTASLGALLALGTMTGAIGGHLTRLGIEVQGDGGLLFFLAIFVFFSSVVIIWIRRDQLRRLGSRIAGTWS